MIKENIRKANGISLVTLSVAIIIMIIITSVLIFNTNTGVSTKALNNMYNDIYLLKDKVDLYYVQYGKLPIINMPYINTNQLKSININDNENYYVIDLELLENLSLNYGNDYEEYKNSTDMLLNKLYIVNEESHNIYYAQGIEYDKKTYYTIPGEYTKIDLPTANCNFPKLASGMTPIKWDGTTIIKTESYDEQWYKYTDTSIEGNTQESKWANVQTEDGSMWVWVPRYAYKIKYNNNENKSAGGKIDVVFLKDDTNLDFKGKDVTNSEYINTKGEVGAYIIHPAFQNGQANNYANGEWNKEITGLWVAKFPAGYAGGNNNIEELDTGISYSGTAASLNYYEAIASGITTMKYPVFMGQTYAYNYINVADAYNLSRNLTKIGNPYGLIKKETDSHIMKNSEWGAVAYLTYSQYGLNGNEVYINNVNLNNTVNTIYGVTGYTGSLVNEATNNFSSKPALEDNISNGIYTSYAWYTEKGQKGSSTGNVTGVYDLSGCVWERISGYIENPQGESNRIEYGEKLILETDLNYKNIYPYNKTSDSSTSNWTEYKNLRTNTYGYGDAILEISTVGTDYTSWNGDYSYFPYSTYAFLIRGGGYDSTSGAGIFAFLDTVGNAVNNIGFRTVLISI